MSEFFGRAARWTARATGHPIAFMLAVALIIVWAVTGPIFGFSDTWQLVINTGTTIATFLMVFLIQNTQNRDTEAVQLKLAELIRVQTGAHNALLDLENMSESDLEEVRQRYEALADEARRHLQAGSPDTDKPEVQAPFVEAEEVAEEAAAEAEQAEEVVAKRRQTSEGRSQ